MLMLKPGRTSFDDNMKLFAIKRVGGVQYLKPTSEAFNSLMKYDLVNLANRELLGDTSHAVAKGLWGVLQREGRSGNFEVDPKTGEAVVRGKIRSESGNLEPKELIRVFDEITFINFSVKDLRF
ncbi:hypothetical protein L1987_65129 [Smallanthus sonchifolius]|uniref:Uncharacterized protein n=1 Tax=Smallanthus sonchifolius TaxID=185202 RepID=A0ACB9BTL5_9ASTR|nr:hypothetical protein L1987_65129 [Smallanthus sonchifolius]